MRGLSSLYKGLSGVEPTADDIGAVKKTGDTMTGALILSGSPTEPNQAATKSYVDSNSLSNPVTVPQGGTGLTTLTTAYGVVCAGTTANGSLQNAGAGTSGQYLKSNGASSLPSFASLDPATTTTQGVVYRKSPTIQKFTSGSGTYTTPAEVLYLRIKMVGGGGGGSGSHLNATSGGTGGNTTFGSSLLVANGGGAGNYTSNASAGGTASLGSAIGTALSGGTGTGGASQGVVQVMGGAGAPSPLGGGGGGGALNLAGQSATTNTGAGGGGGGSGTTANGYSGTGGSAGGFIDAIIPTPSATYSYAVGAAGASGAAGTGGYAGGTGGTGYIEVTEFYN